MTPCSHGSGQNSERRLVETVYCAFRIHGIFQTAHLNLRRANIIFARQKCFYLMIPLCLNACQHMAWHVSAQVAGTDSRAFVFKVQARSPRLFHCLALISFLASRGLSRRGKNERPLLARNHFIFRQNRKSRSSGVRSFLYLETKRKRWRSLDSFDFARGLVALEFVTEIVWTCVSLCVNEVERL